METTRTCPQCHQPLAADIPEGLCPQCLIRAASGPPPSAAGDGLPADFIDIGDPAEIAKKLPQFEILELLGRGGMGVVYKARQLQLDRVVALKILPPIDALSPDFVARFSREARALAKLNHTNIVQVYDFGETGGLYYIVMEFVDGANLRHLLEAGKLTAAEALAIVPKICDALEYAHEEGLVHRDIKPENLLIDKKGRVKIADFGLAKLLRREPLDMTLTLSGTSLGTMRYMAPEQMEKPESVDHRADIYSLGVVIYEMLTGELPMGHFQTPSQKARVDVRLDKIVLHALERDVTRRYQHASEVRTDVENLTSVMEKLPPEMRRMMGFEYRSKATLFGLPWLHITSGMNPRTGRRQWACGIIAIGDRAKGVIAFGGMAIGGLAFGGVGVGIVSFSGLGLGLISIGGFAAGLAVAYGGVALAPFALGGLAVGWVAAGGTAFGQHTMNGSEGDPAALAFLKRWAEPTMKCFFALLPFSVLVPILMGVFGKRWARAAEKR